MGKFLTVLLFVTENLEGTTHKKQKAFLRMHERIFGGTRLSRSVCITVREMTVCTFVPLPPP